MSKGQSSLEQLVMTGLGITFVVIFFVIAFSFANDSTRVAQAQDAVNKLASSADYVYSLGPGSKEQVHVFMPSGLEFANASGNTIHIRIAISSGFADVYANTEANVVGLIPEFSGAQDVSVSYSESGNIVFGDNFLACSPISIVRTYSQGSTSSTSFSITNTGENSISSIQAYTTGTFGSMVSVSSPSGTLAPSTSETLTVNFDIGSLAAPGTYVGDVFVNGSNSNECGVSVTLYILSSEEPDATGPLVTLVNHTPVNTSASTPITITAIGDDSGTGGSALLICDLDLDYAGIWNQMAPVDGLYNGITETVSYPLGTLPLGSHTVRVRCTDILGNTGLPSTYTFIVGTLGGADIAGPVVTDMISAGYPNAFSNITIGATGSDEFTGNSTIQSCSVKLDSGTWNTATPSDGAWDNITEIFTYNLGTLSVGSHTVYYQCTDSAGNIGLASHDSFIVVDVDLMVVLDRSGSMRDYVTNSSSNSVVSTSSSSWTLVKSITVNQKNGDLANISIELKSSTSGCTAFYNATIGGVTVATGSRTSTSYGSTTSLINVSSYVLPYTVSIWLKRDSGGCTVSNRALSLWQSPTKMNAVKSSSKSFVDIAGSNIQAGLVSYSTSATTDKLLAVMTPANQLSLKNAIDAMNPSGNTCIECGLVNGANELVSARAKAGATKVIILLTDGQANVGDSVNGAVYCRDRNVTVYTIGFGYDVDPVELTNVALLTRGEYYFAPDAATLDTIFKGIGR